MNNLNLKSIQTIITDSENAGSIGKAIELATPDLKHLASILSDETTLKEAFLFACVFHKTIDDPEEKLLNFISKHLHCNKMELLDIFDDLSNMKNKGLVMGSSVNERKSRRTADFDFSVNFKIINKIRKGESLIDKPQLKQKNFNSLLDFFHDLVFEKQDGELSQQLFEETTMSLLYENKHLPQVKALFELYENQDQKIHEKYEHVKLMNLDNYHPNHDYIVTLYMLYWMRKIQNLEIEMQSVTQWALGDEGSFNRIIDLIENKKHLLITKDLVSDSMLSLKVDKTTFMITEKGLDYLLGDERAAIAPPITGNFTQILPQNIIERKLYFSEKLNKQLDTVKKLLAPDIFERAQKQMAAELNLNSNGLCIMLYGESGTGKTEYVYQLAKGTNRLLFKVDISTAKNMYYGESERKMKQIFNDYNNIAMRFDVAPILFINEADALFSKRLNVERTVDQTNNGIQNIILDEMENFKGILIATTNLISNLDKAFDRRFLMKINFERASKEAQMQIWKNKFPQLDTTEISQLTAHDLSPALIENVAKKCFIQKWINGTEVNFNDIHSIGSEESMAKPNKNQIGF